jgi:hypothetical protein
LYDLRDLQLSIDQLAKFYKLHDLSKIKPDILDIEEYQSLQDSFDDDESTLLDVFDSSGDLEQAIKTMQNREFQNHFFCRS